MTQHLKKLVHQYLLHHFFFHYFTSISNNYRTFFFLIFIIILLLLSSFNGRDEVSLFTESCSTFSLNEILSGAETGSLGASTSFSIIFSVFQYLPLEFHQYIGAITDQLEYCHDSIHNTRLNNELKLTIILLLLQ